MGAGGGASNIRVNSPGCPELCGERFAAGTPGDWVLKTPEASADNFCCVGWIADGGCPTLLNIPDAGCCCTGGVEAATGRAGCEGGGGGACDRSNIRVNSPGCCAGGGGAEATGRAGCAGGAWDRSNIRVN